MKHLKLFLEHRIEKREFPENGNRLNSREIQILKDLVGEEFLNKFKIRKEDNYYYTYYDDYYNRFDGFNMLKDYVLCRYYALYNIDGLLELLKVTNLDPSFDHNYLIRWSSENGHSEIVKLLLKHPRVDPSVDDNYAIRLASENGYTEIVELLLRDSRVNPSAQNNYCIFWAICNGHTEVVKVLLEDPRVDPSDLNNRYIEYAINKGHKEIVRLLIQDPRVRGKLSNYEIKKYEAY